MSNTKMTAEEIYCVMIHGPFTADGLVDSEGWTREEHRTLLALKAKRLERMKRDCRDSDQLDALLAPIWELYPDISILDAIQELSEPDRTKAFSLYKSIDWTRPLIVECRREHRKEWLTRLTQH